MLGEVRDPPPDLKPKVYLKFVVEEPEDLVEVERLLGFFRVGPESVFLMPQASTLEELRERLGMVVELALRTGFRVSDRLQIVGGFR